MKRIDLNSDMGELPEAVADGSQQALLRFVTSANIACGGHAGTSEMMKQIAASFAGLRRILRSSGVELVFQSACSG